MNRKKIVICIMLAIAVSIVSISVLKLNHIAGYFGFEYGEFTFQGDKFVSRYFEFIEGKSYGKAATLSENRPWPRSDVCGVYGDSNLDFLFVYDGDNSHWYVREGVVIPTNGRITAVFHQGSVTREKSDIALFEKISALEGESVEFRTDNIAAAEREFYFAYNDCPVASFSPGSVVYADDKFFFVKTGDSYYYGGEGIVIRDPDLINFIKRNPIFILPATYPE